MDRGCTSARDETRFGFRECPSSVLHARNQSLDFRTRTDGRGDFFFCFNICPQDSPIPRFSKQKQYRSLFNSLPPSASTCYDFECCPDPLEAILTFLLVQKPIYADPRGSKELELDLNRRAGLERGRADYCASNS